MFSMNHKNESRLIIGINSLILISALVFSVYLVFLYFFRGTTEIGGIALQWGYFGIFLFTTLLELSIQLIGPDVLVAAGILSKLNVFYLLLAITLGSWVGGFIGYYIGKVNGELIMSIFISQKKFRKGVEVFRKYGDLGMTILALTPLPYFPIVAGIFQMRFRNFLLYALLPRTIRWFGLAYLISFFL